MKIQILIILDNGVLREPFPTLIILLDQARYPQNNAAARSFLHNNARNRMRGPRSSAPTSNSHVHFQESLPPALPM